MQKEVIQAELLQYLYDTNPLAAEHRPLPLDKSLYELDILDSYGVVELVYFIEKKWDIRILNHEITAEKFGGVSKMVNLIFEKLSQKNG